MEVFDKGSISQSAEDPFSGHSSCSAAHFEHPAYAEIASELGIPLDLHRKNWEWAFIFNHLARRATQGSRGLGFAVGCEPLAAALANRGAKILATDAPQAVGEAAGWAGGDQLASGLASLPRGRLSEREFHEGVSFQHCDMRAIDPNLREFDFCWSACALEHLGTLRAGLDFIINSVEQTLRKGGVAVHTTELNLESDDDTVEEGWTVLYRKRDLLELVGVLEHRGHRVQPFVVAPYSGPVDRHIDLPPYTSGTHLKLKLEGFIATSCGLVIQRGL